MCVPGCQEAVRRALSRRRFVKGALAASFAAAAAAPDTAGAASTRSFTSAVDLTHTMSPDFPTFSGVPGIEMEKKFDGGGSSNMRARTWTHRSTSRNPVPRSTKFQRPRLSCRWR